MQVVCHSQTVEDHGEGHEDDACDEDVEGVFWFGNAVVSSRQAESEDFADVADVEATGGKNRVSSRSDEDCGRNFVRQGLCLSFSEW